MTTTARPLIGFLISCREQHWDLTVKRLSLVLFLFAGSVGGAAGCTPTVKVATDEPITINLNVNVKHEIRVKVDKELDDLFEEDEGLF